MRVIKDAHEKYIKTLNFRGMKSYANSINDVQVMTTGLQNNATEASQRGWQKANNDRLISARAEAIALNDQQEKMKADLKSKTAELSAKMAEIDMQMKEAKRVVKLGFPQPRWTEFGVADKR